MLRKCALGKLLAVVVSVLAWPGNVVAQNQDYPSRPIKIIVSTPAGGTVDISARIVAERLQQLWGKPVVVENRTGGGNNIAAEAIAKSEPDGYTLLATPPSTVTVNSILYKHLNYDPITLEPVAILAVTPNVLAVKNDLPARTIADLITYAKANPGKLTVASQGYGSTGHLTAELFQSRTGTKMVHVPYRGAAPVLNGLVGGHIDLAFVDLGTIMPMYQSGKVSIIAIAAPARRPEMPTVPTVDESGVKAFNSITFFSLMAPPKTPIEIRTKLNEAIVNAMRTPEVQAKLKSTFLEPGSMNIEEMANYLKSEAHLWSDVVRAGNITLDQ